jgi:hypothetical protein
MSRPWFFLLLPFIYFILYGRFGINETDGGFITALSYRITRGAVPYRDFVWIRPPFTLYFHALILSLLPSNVAFISERLIFYLMIAAYCFLSALTVERYFPLEQFRIGRYQLSAIFFVFSAHNFPPMPWYTVDGIAFSALGIFLIAARNSVFSSVMGIVALELAALTKQSFYPMPLVGIAMVLFLRRKHLAPCFAAAVLVLGSFFLLLASKGCVTLFLIQTRSQTNLRALLFVGVRDYLTASIGMVFVACLIAMLHVRLSGRAMTAGPLLSKAALYFVFAFVVTTCVQNLRQGSFYYQDGYPQVLFLVGLLLLVALYKFDSRQPSIVFAALLAVSWCASVSYGYTTPALFSVPLVFGLVWLANQPGSIPPSPLYAALLFGGALISFVGYQYPYRDAPRAELTEDAGQIFPKLSFIRTSPKKLAMYRELRDLHTKYGDNFQTLPDFTYSHFLTGTDSPIPSDWPSNVDINFQSGAAFELLDRLDTRVFVQKDSLPLSTDPMFDSDLTDRIMHKWKKIDETEFFLVYAKP